MPDFKIEAKREDLAGKILILRKGQCAANYQDPEQPRDYDWGMGNLIAPLIKSGYISDSTSSKHDDRKLRYNHAEIKGASIEIPLGVTYWQAYKADQSRGPEENEFLRSQGMKLFGEEYAFFARPLGITVLPITSDGSIFLGERLNAEYPNFLHGAGGFLDFRQPEMLKIYEDLIRELLEEFGIEEHSFIEAPRAVGISFHAHTGETDISFLVRTRIPDKYFTSGEWEKRVREPEHKNLIRLSSISEIQELLETGIVPDMNEKREIFYSTRCALENLRAEDIRN